ncbi:hypothetical protein GDO78_018749 [Eleutherodactylus coqui]|uniref:Uncharacterized protein n=1 Tax=Eleutherodactylus coqui TaxID=57060 RepID=A0A8J6JV56_ELECQ|nr:hypothetical protein GDO78_018749 [Eleutherodactylus coqui]
MGKCSLDGTRFSTFHTPAIRARSTGTIYLHIHYPPPSCKQYEMTLRAISLDVGVMCSSVHLSYIPVTCVTIVTFRNISAFYLYLKGRSRPHDI